MVREWNGLVYRWLRHSITAGQQATYITGPLALQNILETVDISASAIISVSIIEHCFLEILFRPLDRPRAPLSAPFVAPVHVITPNENTISIRNEGMGWK